MEEYYVIAADCMKKMTICFLVYIYGSFISCVIVSYSYKSLKEKFDAADEESNTETVDEESDEEVESSMEQIDGEILELIEPNLTKDILKRCVVTTNDIIKFYEESDNKTIIENTKLQFAKNTLFPRLVELIEDECLTPIIIDDIYYPSPAVSELEKKLWRDLIYEIVVNKESQYI